ncbi:MAG TPA: hypothetical protein PLB42_05840, partial [Kiritimatiellia bacterium]|nr:hypothetical protein [Kiritimatiellia bacterium]
FWREYLTFLLGVPLLNSGGSPQTCNGLVLTRILDLGEAIAFPFNEKRGAWIETLAPAADS